MSFIHDDQDQSFYDAFNQFIFSSDQKVINKLFSKYFFLEMVKELPGDVVELGVFKGSGILAWLKCLNYFKQHKNVIGFDFFDYVENLNNLQGKQKQMMKSLFEEREFTNQNDYVNVLGSICDNAGYSNYELIKGDVMDTLSDYLDNNPGFRVSLVNFDMDVEEPTYFSMCKLWDRLVVGGVYVFDEYGIGEWSESNAVDQFVRENKLKLLTTNIFAPSAYLVKTA